MTLVATVEPYTRRGVRASRVLSQPSRSSAATVHRDPITPTLWSSGALRALRAVVAPASSTAPQSVYALPTPTAIRYMPLAHELVDVAGRETDGLTMQPGYVELGEDILDLLDGVVRVDVEIAPVTGTV
jgi:hypothetical protein